MKLCGVLLSPLTSFLLPSAFAQCELAELLAGDGAGSDDYGAAVDIDGDVAIVGAPDEDDGGSNAGAAYVYRFDGADWVEEAKLTASSPGPSYHFGHAVAIEGDVAVVGAPDDDDGFFQAGSADVFRFNGATWVFEAELQPADVGTGDRFGWALDVSGSAVVVTSKLDDDVAAESGAAYVFRDTGAGWVEEAKLKASDAVSIAQFGDAVALEGDTIVVGAWQDDDLGFFTGSAYVFERSTGWAETKKLVASDGGDFEWFGRSVDVEGGLALVGAYAGDSGGGIDGGAAYVFRRASGWGEDAKLTAPGAASGDRFGWAVALDGGVAVVGAYERGSAGGTLFFFEESGGSWSQLASLEPSDGAPGDDFAVAVSAGGGRLIAGAPIHAHAAAAAGSAYTISSGGACGLGAPYCQAAANSVSPGGALISASGSASVAANALTLHAGPVPSQPGLFYYGPAQTGVPFGNGFRCVDGVVGRLDVVDPASGEFALLVDLTDPPSAQTQVTAGSTWNYQCWYRDPADGGAFFNLSNGLELTFTP